MGLSPSAAISLSVMPGSAMSAWKIVTLDITSMGRRSMPDHPRRAFLHNDLQPAARRGAEVDHAGAALQDVEFLVDLFQLVGRAGAIALFLRAT